MEPIEIDFSLKWGGFYCTKSPDDELYSLFRLLDFNRLDYHIAIYSEKFETLPTFAEVKDLRPFIGHTPLSTKSIFNKPELHLVGAIPLQEKCLSGYRYYLQDSGYSNSEIDDQLLRLQESSLQPAVSLRVRLVNGSVEIDVYPK